MFNHAFAKAFMDPIVNAFANMFVSACAHASGRSGGRETQAVSGEGLIYFSALIQFDFHGRYKQQSKNAQKDKMKAWAVSAHRKGRVRSHK